MGLILRGGSKNAIGNGVSSWRVFIWPHRETQRKRQFEKHPDYMREIHLLIWG